MIAFYFPTLAAFLPDEIENKSAVDVTINLCTHVRIPVIVNLDGMTVGKNDVI